MVPPHVLLKLLRNQLWWELNSGFSSSDWLKITYSYVLCFGFIWAKKGRRGGWRLPQSLVWIIHFTKNSTMLGKLSYFLSFTPFSLSPGETWTIAYSPQIESSNKQNKWILVKQWLSWGYLQNRRGYLQEHGWPKDSASLKSFHGWWAMKASPLELPAGLVGSSASQNSLSPEIGTSYITSGRSLWVL